MQSISALKIESKGFSDGAMIEKYVLLNISSLEKNIFKTV